MQILFVCTGNTCRSPMAEAIAQALAAERGLDDVRVSSARQPAVNRLVHDAVVSFGGSISAEHGLGVLRRDESARYKSEVELALMRTLKAALDPHHLMNPGKVLS